MTFFELVQLVALTCVASVLLTLFSQRIRAWLKHRFEQYLPPRYLISRGVRRRSPASPTPSAPDESV